ncbi:Hypothetical predicted protein [Paramuricea clavata]|uniref:Uncharacterized protein n=1 Tax=Paramuricea clavata TaxID=317549 RepID=A0A7D9HE36_PARCT|nr:Hypothetical predicted protein [Paramuricea clavata]
MLAVHLVGVDIQTWLIKEFTSTLKSPKAYQYVPSILPLLNPSLIRKWSSVLKCEPGFIKESFESIQKEAMQCPEKKDCCIIIDVMSTRKQTLWDAKQDKYVGFVDYGTIPTEKSDTLIASKAVVFLLVGARIVIGSVQLDTFLLTKCHPKPKHSWLEFQLKWLQRLVFEYDQ